MCERPTQAVYCIGCRELAVRESGRGAAQDCVKCYVCEEMCLLFVATRAEDTTVVVGCVGGGV